MAWLAGGTRGEATQTQGNAGPTNAQLTVLASMILNGDPLCARYMDRCVGQNDMSYGVPPLSARETELREVKVFPQGAELGSKSTSRPAVRGFSIPHSFVLLPQAK